MPTEHISSEQETGMNAPLRLPQKISRRRFLRDVSLGSAGLYIESKRIWAKEIKGGEDWQNGYKNLYKEAMEGENEAASIFIIDKNIQGRWQKFEKGSDTQILLTEDYNNSIKQEALSDNILIIQCHTHSLNSFVKSAELTADQADRMRNDPNFPSVSAPPSVQDGDIDNLVINSLDVQGLASGKTKLFGCVIDPHGAWFYGLEKDSKYASDIYSLKNLKNKITEVFIADPAKEARKQAENVEWFKKFLSAPFLPYVLQTRGYRSNLVESVKSFQSQFKDFWARYGKDYYGLMNAIEEVFITESRVLEKGGSLKSDNLKNMADNIAKKSEKLGIRIISLDHTKAAAMQPKDILKILKVR
jgi:hypothetical protein